MSETPFTDAELRERLTRLAAKRSERAVKGGPQ